MRSLSFLIVQCLVCRNTNRFQVLCCIVYVSEFRWFHCAVCECRSILDCARLLSAPSHNHHHHQLNQKSIEYLIHRRQIHSTPNLHHIFTRLSLVEMAPNLSNLFGLSNPSPSSKASYPVHNFQPKGHVIEDLAKDRLRAFTSDGQFSYLPRFKLTNCSGVNLPPLMFDGRESGKEYVTLEGTTASSYRDTCTSRDRADWISCISAWID